MGMEYLLSFLIAGSPLRRFAICLWLGISALSGQQLKFDVATVKPAAPNDTASGVMPSASPGRIQFRNMTLRLLIYQAYGTGLSTGSKIPHADGLSAWVAASSIR